MKKIIVAVLMGLCLVSSTYAKGRPGEGLSPPKKFDVETLEKKLNLTSNQVAAIEAINDKFRRAEDDIRDKIQPLKERLDKELSSETKDMTRIRNILTEMAPYKVDMHVAKIEHKEAVLNEITYKQVKKLKGMKKESRKEVAEGREPNGDGWDR
jgi:Spy/CpxP family protein refolding chaperone